uniref:Uncharacterized protein n=2 Tax=Meloidogyne TaxID=189290 RepID=A0A6V7XNL9_MELEN|nr:unnamed protein product [Meloidogyne enterolobii]
MTKFDFINKLEAIQTSLRNKQENKHVGENLETIQTSLGNIEENKHVGENLETIRTNVWENLEPSKTNVWEDLENKHVWEELKTIKINVWEKLKDIKTSLEKTQEEDFNRKKQRNNIIEKLKTIQKKARIDNFKTSLEMLKSTKTKFNIDEMKQELLERIPKFEECFKNKKKKSFEQVLNKLELAKTSLLNLEGQTEVLDMLEQIKQVLKMKVEKTKVLKMFREVTKKFEKNKDYDNFVVDSINATKEMLEEGKPYEHVLNKLEITINYLTNCITRINLLNELELTKQSFIEKESKEKLFEHLERMNKNLSKNISLETFEEMKKKLEVEGDIVTKENLIDEELLLTMQQKVLHIQNITMLKPGDNNKIAECKKWEMPESKEKNDEFIKNVEAYRFNLVVRFDLLENLTFLKIVKNSKSIVETIKANKEEGENIVDKKKDMLTKLKNKNKELWTNLKRFEKYLNESEIVIINFIENNAVIRIEDLAQIYRQIRLHSGRNKAVLELFKRTGNLILASKSTIKDVVNYNKGGKIAKEFEIGRQLLNGIIGGYSKKLDSQLDVNRIYETVDWGYLGQEAPEFSDTMSMLSSSTSMLDLGELAMDQSLEDQLSTVDELPSVDEVSSPTNDSFFTSPSKSSVGSESELKSGSPASSSPSMSELPKFGTFTSPSSKSSVGSDKELKFGSPASSTSFGSSPSPSDLSKFSGSTKEKPKKLSKQEKKKLKLHEGEVKNWNDWKFNDEGTVGQLKLLNVQKEAKNEF